MAEAQTAREGRAREYETIYVLRPDVTQENARKIATRVEEVTQRTGGKLTLVETWGRRQLAYMVGKYRRGVYVYLRFLGNGTLVSELERNLRLVDDVLKYQTVKLRDDIDPRDVAVNPDDVKFEEIQPPEQEEEDEPIERILGLEPPGMDREPHGYARDPEPREAPVIEADVAGEVEGEAAGEDEASEEEAP
jgi:small subunit ribosomal protein S6